MPSALLDAPELSAFAAAQLPGRGDQVRLQAQGWCRLTASSRVLLVTEPGGRRWFVKQLERGYKWRREVAAYRSWAPRMGDRMPRLVASERERRLLLLGDVCGTVPASGDPVAYRYAGQALAQLHAAEVRPDGWAAWCDWVRERVDRELHDLRGLGVDVDAGALRPVVAELTALSPQPIVASHGDFLPRNWVVREDRLAMIDFAEAGHHPRMVDVAKLHATTMWGRTDLFEQLVAGYGGRPDAEEVRLLELVRAVAALALLRRGAQRGVPAVAERGRAVLAAVLADQPVALRRPRWRRTTSLAARRVVPRRVVPPAPDPLIPIAP